MTALTTTAHKRDVPSITELNLQYEKGINEDNEGGQIGELAEGLNQSNDFENDETREDEQNSSEGEDSRLSKPVQYGLAALGVVLVVAGVVYATLWYLSSPASNDLEEVLKHLVTIEDDAKRKEYIAECEKLVIKLSDKETGEKVAANMEHCYMMHILEALKKAPKAEIDALGTKVDGKMVLTPRASDCSKKLKELIAKDSNPEEPVKLEKGEWLYSNMTTPEELIVGLDEYIGQIPTNGTLSPEFTHSGDDNTGGAMVFADQMLDDLKKLEELVDANKVEYKSAFTDQKKYDQAVSAFKAAYGLLKPQLAKQDHGAQKEAAQDIIDRFKPLYDQLKPALAELKLQGEKLYTDAQAKDIFLGCMPKKAKTLEEQLKWALERPKGADHPIKATMKKALSPP